MSFFSAFLPRNFMHSRFGLGLRIFLIWTIVGLFLGAVETHTGITWPTVAGKVLECWAWALLTPAILFIDGRMSDAKLGLARRISLLLGFSIPFTAVHSYLAATLQYPFAAIDWNPLRFPSNYVYYFSAGWLTYCAFIGTLQTFHYYRNYANSQLQIERLEKTLLQTHLDALRLQLEPHFMFNALNAIAFEILSEPRRARQMVLDLAALLRLSVNYKHQETVPLSDEIAFLWHYLSIQTVRFGERLKIEMAIAPDTASAHVPSLLLQPLVENAIRHGLSKRLSGGTVTIIANRDDGHLDIRVLDDGIGLAPEWQMEQCTGLGLGVTRERLATLYPDGASCFEIRNRPESGVEVRIRLPLRINDGDTHESAAE